MSDVASEATYNTGLALHAVPRLVGEAHPAGPRGLAQPNIPVTGHQTTPLISPAIHAGQHHTPVPQTNPAGLILIVLQKQIVPVGQVSAPGKPARPK